MPVPPSTQGQQGNRISALLVRFISPLPSRRHRRILQPVVPTQQFIVAQFSVLVDGDPQLLFDRTDKPIICPFVTIIESQSDMQDEPKAAQDLSPMLNRSLEPMMSEIVSGNRMRQFCCEGGRERLRRRAAESAQTLIEVVNIIVDHQGALLCLTCSFAPLMFEPSKVLYRNSGYSRSLPS